MAVGLVLVGSAFGQATPEVPPQVQPVAPSVTPGPTAATEASGGTITGSVKAGAVPLPGVSVTATNTLTGKKYATTTDVNRFVCDGDTT